MILFPSVKSTYSLTLSPGAGTKKKGTTVALKSAVVTVTKKGTENIKKIQIKIGQVVLATVESGINQTGSTTINLTQYINGNTTITAVVTDTANADTTLSASYSFVDPYYYGVIVGEPTAEIVSGLTEKVAAKTTQTIAYSMNKSKAVFAYPSSYGPIKTIIDPTTNFDYTDSFNKYDLTINGVSYYVYVLGLAATSDISFKFSY